MRSDRAAVFIGPDRPVDALISALTGVCSATAQVRV